MSLHRDIIQAYANACADRANAWCRGDTVAESDAADRQRMLQRAMCEYARRETALVAHQVAQVKAQYRT